MTQLVDYAHIFGVKVGVVVGFVDQQQNAYGTDQERMGVRPKRDAGADVTHRA